MRIQWNRDQINRLRSALDACEDAQMTGNDEYVVDLYDVEPPIAAELALEDDHIDILAAESMAYDEELDGWYLAGPVTEAAAVETALNTLI